MRESELDRFAAERPTLRQVVPLRDGETAEQFGLRLTLLEDGTEAYVDERGFGDILPVGFRRETDAEFAERLKAQLNATT